MSKSIPKELQAVYDQVWSYFFHEIPVSEMTLEQVFADEVMGYGTTKDEVIKNLKELHQLLQAQAKQGKGLEIDYKRSTIHKHLSEDRRTGMFAEEFFISIKSGDNIQKIEARSTSVFQLINKAWKLVHMHSSIPSDSENDYWHINEWQAEKEKLEKLVAEQTADLQQKNRELELEAATERVRAAAMGMQQPDDIVKVLRVMKEEIDRFDLGNIGTWLWTITDDQKVVHWELAEHLIKDGPDALNLEFDPYQNAVAKTFIDQIGSEFISYYYTDGTLVNYVETVTPLFPEAGSSFKEAIKTGKITEMWQLCSTFSKGLVGLMFFSKPPGETKEILIKITQAFGLAYQRFLDLQEAEKQTLMIREERDRLEIALEKLQATQDQLVQQEKLASLGQLTAGIAHEIKNPLNFVNNFSEVSEEMMSELIEALDKGDIDESMALSKDIGANLRKIHEHGSRADGIVKSMLQHSRGGDGKMEPTDLNTLIKEYVNLSFHGMRAGKDPIDVDIQLELEENVGEVPLIGEDFSRVILNLCNNAFDAMREKLTADSRQLSEKPEQGYKPKLTVRTQTRNGTLTIEIEDNGPGIPDEIKDKILQPFFTTKKGTQGTGLGLSITNDIIKAHGGSLDVHSQPGQTVFSIKLNN